MCVPILQWIHCHSVQTKIRVVPAYSVFTVNPYVFLCFCTLATRSEQHPLYWNHCKRVSRSTDHFLWGGIPLQWFHCKQSLVSLYRLYLNNVCTEFTVNGALFGGVYGRCLHCFHCNQILACSYTVYTVKQGSVYNEFTLNGIRIRCIQWSRAPFTLNSL